MLDLRCPGRTGKLFARIREIDDPASWVEVACRDCRNDARARGVNAGLVLHLFDGRGVCVETVVVETREGKTPTSR